MDRKTEIKIKDMATGNVLKMEVTPEHTAEEMINVAMITFEYIGPVALRQGLRVIRNGATGLSGDYEIVPDPIGGNDIIMVEKSKIWNHKYCDMEGAIFEYPDENTLYQHILYLGGFVPDEIIEHFSTDGDWYVRLAIARRGESK